MHGFVLIRAVTHFNVHSICRRFHATLHHHHPNSVGSIGLLLVRLWLGRVCALRGRGCIRALVLGASDSWQAQGGLESRVDRYNCCMRPIDREGCEEIAALVVCADALDASFDGVPIQEVVARNEKQRFAISPLGSRRHIVPPEFLCRGTATRVLASFGLMAVSTPCHHGASTPRCRISKRTRPSPT